MYVTQTSIGLGQKCRHWGNPFLTMYTFLGKMSIWLHKRLKWSYFLHNWSDTRNGCEVWIENSFTRVTVQHHKACRVRHPEWLNFQFTPKNHYRFFFLHTLPLTTTFSIENVLLYYQFHARITTFSSKKCSVRQVDVKTFGTKWCKKWRQNRHARGRLTSKTDKNRRKPCRVCEKY